jgi:hypothetical protein
MISTRCPFSTICEKLSSLAGDRLSLQRQMRNLQRCLNESLTFLAKGNSADLTFTDSLPILDWSAQLILHMKRRTVFRPRLPSIKPSRGYVRMSQPLLHLGNVRLIGERVRRRRRAHRMNTDANRFRTESPCPCSPASTLLSLGAIWLRIWVWEKPYN